MSDFVTKPGKHGTLYRWEAEVRDPIDPGQPPWKVCCWAYSAEHAREIVQSDPDWLVEITVGTVVRVREPNAPRT